MHHPLKYGRNMETVARDKYLSYFKKSRQNVSYRECGLFLYPPKPYLGASPDLLVECSCCGQGVLEIKCPYSLLNEVPAANNVPYLELRNGQTVLKKKHSYFAQIQGQMSVTERNWCHFLIYTQKGQHFEKIFFEKEYWFKIENNLILFYIRYFAPILLNTLTIKPNLCIYNFQ